MKKSAVEREAEAWAAYATARARCDRANEEYRIAFMQMIAARAAWRETLEDLPGGPTGDKPSDRRSVG